MKDIISINKVDARAYTIPTQTPESDGTIKWSSTTLVLVTLHAGDKEGIGYSYTHLSMVSVIKNVLAEVILQQNCFDISLLNQGMIAAVRNLGASGLAMMAVSAVDNALWDLKAKILDLPLVKLLGMNESKMLLYGSGGFTSYTEKQTADQFEVWAKMGITNFKMKVGRNPLQDEERVKAARNVIGRDANLFVDANGAFHAKEAVTYGSIFSKYNVSWYEEPVTSDNLSGLHFVREHSPSPVRIAAGEYGFSLPYFHSMLSAGAVDILQADATRCGGISNFLKVGAMAAAEYIPFSSHCAPLQHLHAALATPGFYIAEYFFDHERIENMLFETSHKVKEGCMHPDLSRSGIGATFKYEAAKKYEVY